MCNNTASRYLAWGFSVAVMAQPLMSLADTLPNMAQAEVAITVEQMLVIDTRIALSKEQQREREAMGLKQAPLALAAPVSQPAPKVAPIDNQDKAEPPAAPEMPKAPTLSVEGIFGLGDQLFAQVLIDGRMVRFKKNQRYPVGYDSAFPYLLVSINVPCIRLTGPGGPQKLCIDGLQEN